MAVTEPNAAAQIQTRRSELGQPMPRRFSQTAWWRFSRDRRRRYLARIDGPPTDHQVGLVVSLTALEWNALKNEAANTLASDKVSVNARRLLQRLLHEFEKSVTSTPGEQLPTLAEVLRAGRAEAAE